MVGHTTSPVRQASHWFVSCRWRRSEVGGCETRHWSLFVGDNSSDVYALRQTHCRGHERRYVIVGGIGVARQPPSLMTSYGCCWFRQESTLPRLPRVASGTGLTLVSSSIRYHRHMRPGYRYDERHYYGINTVIVIRRCYWRSLLTSSFTE